MAKQLLIYETAVPVNKQRHGNWSVRTGSDYSFMREVNSVPLTAVEFAHAASEYTIVFSGADGQVMPAVILGMRDHENLYLGEGGAWQSRYVPAFVRRYPFVFSSSPDGKTFTLCVDEQFAGCNQDGRGERLFDADGERTQYLANVLNFLREYQAQFQRTQAFCAKLKELKLLEPMQALFTLGSGERTTLGGFMGIERERLKALSGAQLAELASSDELELAYLHLHSLRNVRAMADRVVPKATSPADEPADAEKADAADRKSAKKRKGQED